MFFHDHSVGGSHEEDGGAVKEVVAEIRDTYFSEVTFNTQKYSFAICKKK